MDRMHTQDEIELLGFDTFPNSLWYLKDEAANKYGAYHIEEPKIYGEPFDCLAVFATSSEAGMVSGLLDTCSPVPVQVSFDEAREIAKTCGKAFRALALLAYPFHSPVSIHFID